jgi:hypothetical protein
MALLAQTLVTQGIKQAARRTDNRVQAIGQDFVRALEKYQLASPDDPALPTSIAQLLEDTRNGRHRHLRAAPAPIFDGSTWQPVLDPQGQITGIYLNASQTPARRVVRLPDGTRQNITTYADWKFTLPSAPEN